MTWMIAHRKYSKSNTQLKSKL